MVVANLATAVSAASGRLTGVAPPSDRYLQAVRPASGGAVSSSGPNKLRFSQFLDSLLLFLGALPLEVLQKEHLTLHHFTLPQKPREGQGKHSDVCCWTGSGKAESSRWKSINCLHRT